MRTDSTSIGEIVRKLRKARNLSRMEMAEMIKISVSHLEKIESGARRPGIDTYQRILEIVRAETVIRGELETVQERCARQIEDIILASTEERALFMYNILEFIAQKMDQFL